MSLCVETKVTLNDDVVTEVLLWLPSTSVLRCRAVCKAWYRISTDPLFLADQAGRRPLELLVRAQSETVLHTVRLSLQRQVDEHEEGCYPHRLQLPEHCLATNMVGSCNGLLLFTNSTGFSSYYVCNPVTRQVAWLNLMPPSCGFLVPCGFYLHRPSSECRILVLANEGETGLAAHYIFSAGGTVGPRRLGPVAPDLVVECYTQIPVHYVRHRSKLHWTSHPQAKRTDSILAFDTVSEAFRLIRRPPTRSHDCDEELCLLEMHGMLALATFLDDCLDLWVLEDYSNDRSWSRRAMVDLPPPFHARWAVSTGIPDVVLVGSYTYGFVGLYHLVEKKMIKQIQLTNGKMATQAPFLFSDSLVPSAFFN